MHQSLLDTQTKIFELFYPIDKSEYDPDEDLDYTMSDLDDRAFHLDLLLKEFIINFKQYYLIADEVEFNHFCIKSFKENRDLKTRFDRYVEFIYKHPQSMIDEDELAALGEYNEINSEFFKEILLFISPYLSSGEKMPLTIQKRPEYSLLQVALIKNYSGHIVNKPNSDEIAQEYGYKSGHRLYQFFNKYNRPSEIHRHTGRIQDLNMIKNLEAILKHFSDRKNVQDKISEHIKILKNNMPKNK